MSLKSVRIFLSSPSDVGYERARAEIVARRLEGLIDGLKIETFRWEAGRYFSAHQTFQAQIPSPETFDIVVGLFWSRVGSPLPLTWEKMPDGRTYPSGTAFEILRAIQHRQMPETNLPDILIYKKTEKAEYDPEDPNAARVFDEALKLQAFIDEWFVNEAEGFKAAFTKFRTVDDFELLFEEHLRNWLRDHRRLGRERRWRIEERGSPFRGLQPFDADHSEVFFGRRLDTERARERLESAAARGVGFLLIEGPSGAGKSSLARAGLLPRLRQIDPILREAVVIPRIDPSSTPLASLVAALFEPGALPELAAGDFPSPKELTLHLSGGGGTAPVERALERAGESLKVVEGRGKAPQIELLLLIDQCEQIFAHTVSGEERRRFAFALAALVRSRRVRVVVTLRADAVGAALGVPPLAELMDQGARLSLTTPRPDALAEIVHGPAEAAGLAYERAPGGECLDEILLRDAGGPDSLPFLQFTLDLLYRAALERVGVPSAKDGEPFLELRFADYTALGGIDGAISKQADAVLEKLPDRARASLPQLLRALVASKPEGLVSEGALDLPVLQAPLLDTAAPTPEARALVEALTEARLLVRDEDRVRLAHQRVVSAWPAARQAVAAAEQFLRVRDELKVSSARWLDGAKSRDLLLPAGVRLAEAEEMVLAHPVELRPFQDYVRASGRRARNRQRLTGLATFLFAAVALAAGWFGYQSNVNEKLASAKASEAERELARANEAEAAASHAADTARASERRALDAEQRAVAAAAEASREAWTAKRNGAGLLAANSGEVLRSGNPVEAVKLALAAWPNRHETNEPQLREAIAAASAAIPALRERIRLNHGAWVTSVAFSPRGDLVATGSLLTPGSKEGSVHLWDTATGLQVASFGIVGTESVAFSPDGTRIATGHDDGFFNVWDAATLQELVRVDAAATSISFSPDGSRLVTAGGRDNTARLWDLTSDMEVARFVGHQARIQAVAFAPDGKLIATGSVDGDVRLWVPSTGQEVSRLAGHGSSINGLAFSPDGLLVASASSDGTARVWDAATGLEVERLELTGLVWGVSFSPDSRLLAIGTKEGALLYDLGTGEVAERLVGHAASGATQVVFSADGTRLATASDDGTARVWDVATLMPVVRFLGHNDEIDSVAVSPDGAHLLTGSRDETIRLWDLMSGTELVEISENQSPVSSVIFTKGGMSLIAGYNDGTARLWDLTRKIAIATFVGHQDGITSVTLSPDGSKLATGSGDGTARLWDVNSSAELSRFTAQGSVYAVEFSPDGASLATGGLGDSLNGAVQLWDVATQAEINHLELKGRVTGIAFSPDGARLAIGSDSGGVLWDPVAGKTVSDLYAYGAVEFSPDGTRVAAAGYLHSPVAIWDVATGATLGLLDADGWVTSLAFTNDGKRLITGSHPGIGDHNMDGGTAQVWDLANLPEGNAFDVACAWIPLIDGKKDIDVNVGFTLASEKVCGPGYDPPAPWWMIPGASRPVEPDGMP